jgi:hypothetical protein
MVFMQQCISFSIIEVQSGQDIHQSGYLPVDLMHIDTAGRSVISLRTALNFTQSLRCI